jgi:hypothetical protein
MFYPGDPAQLKSEISLLLLQAKGKRIEGIIRGIISPHAGYRYSGFTAANAYSLVQGIEYETVVIVSPSHREYFDGVSVFQGEAYETPLGTVPLDTKLRERLKCEAPFVVASDFGHGEEHAIEVQLPFLQHVLHQFHLLPVVIGNQDRKYCFGLGEALATVLSGSNYLLVASTDLSHYHSSDAANALDKTVMDDVAAFDYERLMSGLEAGTTEACGGGPMVATMVALQRLGVKHIEVLHHCNSGDITGDRNRVVGYLSAVAYE